MFGNITREQAYKHWLTSLRSGKFKQTKNQLKFTAPTEYCCLGVVCETIIKLGKVIKWETTDWGSAVIFGNDQDLPFSVLSFLGMTLKEQATLINLNDDQNKTFKEIADYIEFKIMPKALARPVNYYVRRKQ